MSKKCKDCKGRGRWLEREVTDEGTTEQWMECGTCHGTGLSQLPQDAEPFDLGGEE